MDWDLITERNIQLFIRLSGLAERPLATNMFWQQGQYETYLNYQSGRIHLCQIFLQTFLDEELLVKALTNWQPARFTGIPQRLFLLRDGLAISCSPPPASTAELWLRLYHRQIKFLESQCVHV
ncbi:type III secretion system apparatus protein [Salmonella enterica subsp. salamae]|nr:type III secretion system apparatus protein [Salmonella enterica subsp. salamae]ECJ2280070.1 type III secretion system apparatus protein [Salmonella enterica subsp. salamae]HCC0886923.1 type III secretion system apparatus protein [Salmonella enterica]